MKSCNQQRAQDLPIWELVLTGGLGCCSMGPMQSHWDFCSSQEFSLYLLQAGFSNITTNSSGLFFILFYLVFFFFFLDVEHFFQVFIELVTILLLFYVLLSWPQGMGDLSSPTRDQTHTPCIGRPSLNRWTAMQVFILYYFWLSVSY